MLSNEERIEQLKKKVEFLAMMLQQHHHGYPNYDHTMILNDNIAVMSKCYMGDDRMPAYDVDTVEFLTENLNMKIILTSYARVLTLRSNTLCPVYVRIGKTE